MLGEGGVKDNSAELVFYPSVKVAVRNHLISGLTTTEVRVAEGITVKAHLVLCVFLIGGWWIRENQILFIHALTALGCVCVLLMR